MNEVWSVKNRTSGFTLVELMVVVLLVGLAVLVFTQIPLFGLSSWRKGSERLRMQRDANLMMIKIRRKLRPASSSNIDVSDSHTLVIDQNTGEKFFLNDQNHLSYQGPEGTPELVIPGDTGTTQFNVTNPTGTIINVTLTLVREGVQTTLRTAVKPRN